MSEDLEAIDRLLDQVPRWKCPNCGITDPKQFLLFHAGTFEATIFEVDETERRLHTVESTSEWHIDHGAKTRIMCMNCKERYNLPDDYSWD